MAVRFSALNPWAMFALGVVPMNVVWVVIGGIVRRRGLPWSWWNVGMLIGLSSFQRIIRDEKNPKQKGDYRALGIAFCVSLGWCLFWLVRIAVTRAGP